MNIEDTAKQLQALFEQTNKAVKGNGIAPETDDIVKILRDNLSGGSDAGEVSNNKCGVKKPVMGTGQRTNPSPAQPSQHNPELLSGDIELLKSPDYHALNKHSGRNDRLLHAVLCAYLKHHFYEDNHIGWDELNDILFYAITSEVGDEAFCKWVDSLASQQT